MILCDTNIWLALTLSGHSFHKTACRWIDRQDRINSLYFCRCTQQSYLRLLTHPKLLQAYGNKALTNTQAWELFDKLMVDARIDLKLEEPPGLDKIWRQYALRDTSSGKLWMDAYLAAFARASNFEMVTIDRAFQQFDGLHLTLLSKDAAL